MPTLKASLSCFCGLMIAFFKENRVLVSYSAIRVAISFAAHLRPSGTNLQISQIFSTDRGVR